MVGDINGEMKVPSSMEARLVAINKDSRFVVNGAKIKKNPLAFPRRRDRKRGGEPRV